MITSALSDGKLRFSDLRSTMDGTGGKVLAAREAYDTWS